MTIDVVMLAYNRREFTELALRSLDKYLDFGRVGEFVIADMGSTDGTRELCEAWGPARVIDLPNAGRANLLSLVRAARDLPDGRWALLWLNDWYLCEPMLDWLLPFRDDCDAMTSHVVTTLDGTGADAVLGVERERVKVSDRFQGGPCAFRSEFLHRLADLDGELGSVMGTLETLPGRGLLHYTAERVTPPPAFLHLDVDLQGHPVADALYAREGIDTGRILRLTDEYFDRKWGRHRSDGGHVLEYRKRLKRDGLL